MLHKLAAAVVIAAIPTAYALAQSDSGMIHGEMMMKMKSGMQMTEADKGYMATMQNMQQNMAKMEMTGDPSGDFVRMMNPASPECDRHGRGPAAAEDRRSRDQGHRGRHHQGPDGGNRKVSGMA
jgi:hypothetical protein